MSAGDRFPPERRAWVEPETGTAIVQLTNTPCINHAPYFLNQAWAFPRGRGGESCLIVTSYRDGGRANLYAVDEASGELLQLTDTGEVNPWSACVGRDGSHVFYGAGRELRAVEVATAYRSTVAVCPGDAHVDTGSLSPDGAELVTSAFSGESSTHGRRNALLAIRTDGSGVRTAYETERFVGHAQFSPNGRQILFSSDLPRLWLVNRDGTDPHPLRGQTRREWLTHESWLNDDEIIYTHWPHALRSIRRDGTGDRAVAAFNCWHPAPRPDGGLIVCDTALPDVGLVLIDPRTGARRTLCQPRASCQGYQWALPEPIWDGPTPEAAYGPQWTHPHPSYSPDGARVVYTSDATGHPQVYVATV
ncbi:MAG: PD40 domain-containing protein [Chloroflexi bacterium]|nr:PD40 domain-containing protein [Chloroflexota bacterium]